MNIFELSEKEIKKVFQDELNKVAPEELLEELVECGLEIKEDLNLKIDAEYNVIESANSSGCNLWVHIETTGWTSFKKAVFGKIDDDYDTLKEAV